MQKIYTNKDFYLSAYLVAEGFELFSFNREHGLTQFHFEESEKLQKSLKKFFSLAATVEPVKYGNAIKSLKTLIHSEQTSNSKSNNFYAPQQWNN